MYSCVSKRTFTGVEKAQTCHRKTHCVCHNAFPCLSKTGAAKKTFRDPKFSYFILTPWTIYLYAKVCRYRAFDCFTLRRL